MKPRMILAVLLGLVLSMTISGSPAWAADCGDTAGPSGERVPCACGDDVVTDTALRPSDPVVSTDPSDFCSGTALFMFVPDITLDCKGLTLRGDLSDDGIYVGAWGTTVKGCVITEFAGFAGIHVDAGNTALLNNKLIANAEAGISFHFETGNRAERNQAHGNGCWGLTIDFDNDDSVARQNRANGNGCGGILVDSGSTGNVLSANITDANVSPGILVEESGNTLETNRGKDNSGDGITVTVPGNTLRNNVEDTNGGHGICAVAGNTDAGGNRGTGNATPPDVDFDC